MIQKNKIVVQVQNLTTILHYVLECREGSSKLKEQAKIT